MKCDKIKKQLDLLIESYNVYKKDKYIGNVTTSNYDNDIKYLQEKYNKCLEKNKKS